MRRFELEDEKSSKFWEVSTEGSLLTVRYGRLGTSGQTKEKDLGSAAAAAAELEGLVREKTKKGYVEVTSVTATDAPASAALASADPPDGESSEAVAATLQALADIEEWFTDQGATVIVADLNGPVTDSDLEAAAKELGHPIPLELGALYRAHDGQRTRSSSATSSSRMGSARS